MTRDEYLCDTRPHAKRGEQLPHAKLTANEVVKIRAAAIRRDALRQQITDELSNAALAKTYGVSVPTIEKVLRYETWGHVA